MSDSVDLQSEQFMTLLTDALRAGPGSPEWNQAVKALRATNGNTDELTLLTTAREHLESGKEFRSVRAGAGFTRRVLEGIEQEEKAAGGPPTANLIALIAAGAILGVVVIISVMLFKGSNPQRHAIDELTGQIFGNKFLTAGFNGPPGPLTTAPEGWRPFGEVPLLTKGGELQPAPLPATLPTTTEAGGYKAGGLITATPLAPEQVIEVDVTFRLAKPADDSIAEVFISEEPLTDGNAYGGRALVCQIKSGDARVYLADGNPAKRAEKAEKLTGPRDVAVKILLNRDTAVINAAGQRVYAGPHLLAADKPHYVGVRFRRRAGDKGDSIGIAAVAVLKS